MMNITGEKLDNINQTLQKQNEILSSMKQPENMGQKIISTAGTVVGIFGIIHIIDTVMRWLRG